MRAELRSVTTSPSFFGSASPLPWADFPSEKRLRNERSMALKLICMLNRGDPTALTGRGMNLSTKV